MRLVVKDDREKKSADPIGAKIHMPWMADDGFNMQIIPMMTPIIEQIVHGEARSRKAQKAPMGVMRALKSDSALHVAKGRDCKAKIQHIFPQKPKTPFIDW